MVKKRHGIAAVVALGALALAGCSGSAGGSSAKAASDDTSSNYKPKGNVTMIVPFAAGGGSDIAGRATASGFADASGENISVQNIEGGSGAVGYSSFLADSGKDSYLLASETALLALPLTQKVQFDYTSYTPIMKLGDDSTLIVVRPDSPFKTCTDLVDSAKKKPLKVAISGITGLDNVVFTLISQKTGAQLTKVPFESGAETITALLGGNVDAISDNPGEVAGQLKAGTLRALCAAADKRYTNDELKDIPTAKEEGIDVAFAQYRGVIAPGGISDQAKAYWIGIAKKFAQSDAYKKYIDSNMMSADALYGDDFGKYLASNNAKLKSVLEASK